MLSFSEDETGDFMNPERGWMIRQMRFNSAFINARSGDSDVPFGYTLAWGEMGGVPWNGTLGTNPFRWDNYKTQNLPQSLLDELTATFAAARLAGIKMKVRFVYSYTLGANPSDTTQAWMQTHIAQVAPILNANRDVIVQVDAGLIAAFGEWAVYTNSDLVDSTNNWWQEPWVSARRAVYQTWLDNLHPDIMLGLRTPRGDNGYRSFFNGGGGRANWATHDHVANRFDGSDISRTGFYMDCLWTNVSHGDTFDYFTPSNTAPDLAAAAAGARIAPVTGETCNLGGLNAENDGSLVLGTGPKSGRTLGVDALYRKFWPNMYSKWIAEGTYPEISRSLGYRLVLVNAEVPESVTPGATMQVKLTIRNRGFGKVYNPRPIDLVMVGPSNTRTVRLTADARRDLPLGGDVTTTTYSVSVPADLVVGNLYSLFLRLPDPDPLGNGLADDNRYAIRLANLGMWNGATGRHDLGAFVNVVSA